MHTSQRISKFYEDLERLDLKFPGKEIANKLNISKGYVSDVINKKKEPSEEFLNDFYKYFPIQFSNSSQPDSEQGFLLQIGPLKVTLKDYVDLLKEQTKKAEEEKDRLLNIIENNLTKLLEVSLSLSSNLAEVREDTSLGLAYQRTWVEYTAEQASEGDKKKKDQKVLHMNKLLRSQIDRDQKANRSADAHKQHKAS